MDTRRASEGRQAYSYVEEPEGAQRSRRARIRRRSRRLVRNAGQNISLGRYATVQAGYWLLDADVHTKDQSDVIRPDFRGPAFSIQFRDR